MRTIVLYEKFITSALHSYHTASVAAVTAATIALGVLAIACVSVAKLSTKSWATWHGLDWFGFGLKCNIVTSDYVVTNDGCYHHLTYVNREFSVSFALSIW